MQEVEGYIVIIRMRSVKIISHLAIERSNFDSTETHSCTTIVSNFPFEIIVA